MSEDSDPEARHSQAEDAELIKDPDQLAEAEARNGLRQYDAVEGLIADWIQPERTFRLRVSMILTLHRIALEGISLYAGNFRPGKVKIGKSKHIPPEAHLVPESVEHMCDYINENWGTKTAIHLAAYAMWQLNWIHPFSDGNGRTSRAISYLVLCVKLGHPLPGKNTVPEQISNNKAPYYEALEKADDILKETGKVNVSALEDLLEAHLAKQLAEVHRSATGSKLEA